MRVGFHRGRRSCRRSASGHQPAEYELVRMGLGHSGGKRQRGRLLEALLARTREQASNRTIMAWLLAVFRRVTGRHEKRGKRWWQRIFSRGDSKS